MFKSNMKSWLILLLMALALFAQRKVVVVDAFDDASEG